MGAKITIDSASMMNKGFEVIEAKWLFDVSPQNIEIAVHPQSIVHSMVQFKDGSVKAQLGTQDMRLPIRYALSYPARLESSAPKLTLEQYSELTFEYPDFERFPLLRYAFDAVATGGNMPCIMNAANEIAVAAADGCFGIVYDTVDFFILLRHRGKRQDADQHDEATDDPCNDSERHIAFGLLQNRLCLEKDA